MLARSDCLLDFYTLVTQKIDPRALAHTLYYTLRDYTFTFFPFFSPGFLYSLINQSVPSTGGRGRAEWQPRSEGVPNTYMTACTKLSHAVHVVNVNNIPYTAVDYRTRSIDCNSIAHSFADLFWEASQNRQKWLTVTGRKILFQVLKISKRSQQK